MYYTEREGRGWKGYVFIFTDCVGFRWFSANAAGRAFISPFKRSDKSNQSSVSLVRLNPASLASQDYSSRRTTLSLFRSPPFHSILRHEQPVTFSLFSSMELIEYFFLFILPFLYTLFSNSLHRGRNRCPFWFLLTKLRVSLHTCTRARAHTHTHIGKGTFSGRFQAKDFRETVGYLKHKDLHKRDGKMKVASNPRHHCPSVCVSLPFCLFLCLYTFI